MYSTDLSHHKGVVSQKKCLHMVGEGGGGGGGRTSDIISLVSYMKNAVSTYKPASFKGANVSFPS